MKPVVMVSNLYKLAGKLLQKFPGRIGMMLGPGQSWTDPRGIPYAYDNGRFPIWNRGGAWDELLWLDSLRKSVANTIRPLWIVVPDVVANREATIKEWNERAPELEQFGPPLAIAVQDGMTPTDIHSLDIQPTVIFVGGSTTWKWRNLQRWCDEFPRVHIGRVNTYGLLWKADRAGAESSDGTGWWHDKQQAQLIKYLERSRDGLGEQEFKGFFF